MGDGVVIGVESLLTGVVTVATIVLLTDFVVFSGRVTSAEFKGHIDDVMGVNRRDTIVIEGFTSKVDPSRDQ